MYEGVIFIATTVEDVKKGYLRRILFHFLGFSREDTRYDRDKYISVENGGFVSQATFNTEYVRRAFAPVILLV